MTSERADASGSREAARAHRRRIAEAKQGLRELRIELAALNHRVGSRIEIKDVDFDCLDVITRHGPITPTALARRIGVHLATMTGILDRLSAADGSCATGTNTTGEPADPRRTRQTACHHPALRRHEQLARPDPR